MRSFLRLVRTLAVCFLTPALLLAQPKPDVRYLFLADTSAEMASQRENLADAVAIHLLNGLDGQIRAGELFAVWTLGGLDGPRRYPPVAWTAETAELLATQFGWTLHDQPFQGHSRFGAALTEVLGLAAQSDSLQIVVLHQQPGFVVGTGFDQKITAACQELRQAKGGQPLFVTTLLVRRGAVAAWGVEALTAEPGGGGPEQVRPVQSTMASAAPAPSYIEVAPLEPLRPRTPLPAPPIASEATVPPATEGPPETDLTRANQNPTEPIPEVDPGVSRELTPPVEERSPAEPAAIVFASLDTSSPRTPEPAEEADAWIATGFESPAGGEPSFDVRSQEADVLTPMTHTAGATPTTEPAPRREAEEDRSIPQADVAVVAAPAAVPEQVIGVSKRIEVPARPRDPRVYLIIAVVLLVSGGLALVYFLRDRTSQDGSSMISRSLAGGAPRRAGAAERKA